MDAKALNDIRRKLKVLKHAEQSKNITATCRYYGICRETFYQWKRRYSAKGEAGLINSKPCPENPTLRVPPPIEEKILYLRKTYHLGQQRISWYLARYHDLKVSPGGVRGVLLRHGLNRLPKNEKKRSLPPFKRYEKQVPGHRIQVDVKFLFFKDQQGHRIKRFQYTAIDDATRIRALKIYSRHTQQNAINFINYVIDKFPFRIHTVQTDNGHEWQAKFHWHCEDLGMRHIYIKPRTPRLNGKVERSHSSDKTEFYQLITYTSDVDLQAKLKEWEIFYNCHRPHGGLKGHTPYEVLKRKLLINNDNS
jgi:transposase InsO family protein